MTNRRQIIAVTVVLTALCANAVHAGADDPGPSHNATAETSAAPEERRLRLAVVGLSAIGVLGLLWVRRHTSEP
jgi:hypothetical protein